MDLNTTGRIIIGLGFALIILGGLLLLFSRIPILKNLGNLPGDVRYQSGNLSCFFPVVSMIIISILLSIALNIIVRLVNR